MSHRQPSLSPRLTRASWMLLMAVLISSTQLAGCKKAPPQQQALHAIPVTVLQVEPRDVPVNFEFVAQTQSSHRLKSGPG